MNIETTLRIESTTSAETEQIGELLGKNSKGGEIIELKSDLGGGKTTLVRGLAKGLESPDTVASPSFTILKIYSTPRVSAVTKENISIQHFDFYRLGEHPEQMSHQLEEAMLDKSSIVVLEWATAVEQMLPEVRLQITINKTDDDARELVILCPIQLFYLVEGLGAKVG